MDDICKAHLAIEGGYVKLKSRKCMSLNALEIGYSHLEIKKFMPHLDACPSSQK